LLVLLCAGGWGEMARAYASVTWVGVWHTRLHHTAAPQSPVQATKQPTEDMAQNCWDLPKILCHVLNGLLSSLHR